MPIKVPRTQITGKENLHAKVQTFATFLIEQLAKNHFQLEFTQNSGSFLGGPVALADNKGLNPQGETLV